MMTPKQSGELRLPARAVLVFERDANVPRVGADHAAFSVGLDVNKCLDLLEIGSTNSAALSRYAFGTISEARPSAGSAVNGKIAEVEREYRLDPLCRIIHSCRRKIRYNAPRSSLSKVWPSITQVPGTLRMHGRSQALIVPDPT
jgi:hypothetical protein